jgi:hypothetical protein
MRHTNLIHQPLFVLEGEELGEGNHQVGYREKPSADMYAMKKRVLRIQFTDRPLVREITRLANEKLSVDACDENKGWALRIRFTNRPGMSRRVREIARLTGVNEKPSTDACDED